MYQHNSITRKGYSKLNILLVFDEYNDGDKVYKFTQFISSEYFLKNK